MKVAKKGYYGLALPEQIVDEIRNEIQKEDSLYTNITDFVKQAVREKLEKLRQTAISSIQA